MGINNHICRCGKRINEFDIYFVTIMCLKSGWGTTDQILKKCILGIFEPLQTIPPPTYRHIQLMIIKRCYSSFKRLKKHAWVLLSFSHNHENNRDTVAKLKSKLVCL